MPSSRDSSVPHDVDDIPGSDKAEDAEDALEAPTKLGFPQATTPQSMRHERCMSDKHERDISVQSKQEI